MSKKLTFYCLNLETEAQDYEIEVHAEVTRYSVTMILDQIGKEKCMEYFGLIERSNQTEVTFTKVDVYDAVEKEKSLDE